MNETGNENGGRCFVTFESEDAGERAVAELCNENNETMIGDFPVTMYKLRNNDWPRWKRSVFVHNLSWNCEEWHLDEYFSSCGEILSIRIIRDHDGRSKGFGFIEFLDK